MGIWTGLGGDQKWSTDINWDDFAVPDINENVIIPASSGRVHVDQSSICKNLQIGSNNIFYLDNDLIVDNSVTNSGSIIFNNGAITVNGNGTSDPYPFINYTDGNIGFNTGITSAFINANFGNYGILSVNGYLTINGNFANYNFVGLNGKTDSTSFSKIVVTNELICGRRSTPAPLVSEVRFTIDSNTQIDFIQALGNTELEGKLTVVVDGAINFVPDQDTRFPVILYSGSLSGGFDTTDFTAIPKYRYLVSYILDAAKIELYREAKVGAAIPVNPIKNVSFNANVATFTDPGRINPITSDFTASVDWGDGGVDTNASITGDYTGFYVNSSHIYSNVSSYTITIRIADIDNSNNNLVLTSSPSIQDNTTTSLSTSDDEINYGDTVYLTATIIGTQSNPTSGSIAYYSNGIFIGNANLNGSNVAIFGVNNLPGGVDSITASYPGNSNFAPSSSGASPITVNPVDTTTTLSVSTHNAALGGQIILTANVTSTGMTPNGTVQFYDTRNSVINLIGQNTLDNSGNTSITVTTLQPGLNAIQAQFVGNSSFNYSISNTENITIYIQKSLGQLLFPSDLVSVNFVKSSSLSSTLAFTHNVTTSKVGQQNSNLSVISINDNAATNLSSVHSINDTINFIQATPYNLNDVENVNVNLLLLHDSISLMRCIVSSETDLLNITDFANYAKSSNLTERSNTIILNDGVTVSHVYNTTLSTTISLTHEVDTEDTIIITLPTYHRLKSVPFNVTPITFVLKGAEKPNAPDYFSLNGDTGIANLKILSAPNESNPSLVQDLFHISLIPGIANNDGGIISLQIEITPINGDEEPNVTKKFVFIHPQNMDGWSDKAGHPRMN